MTARVLVCCGVGGTGKTTTSAALGLAHAAAGYRTVVLTIDPARRLADALGIELTNEPSPIPGVPNLQALMLDREASWNDVVHRFSDSPEQARELLDNPYFRAVARRLTGSHEYMAVEKLYQLVHSGEHDLVVVDTPPAQHVLDFFQAPERVQSLLERGGMQSMLNQGGVMGLATQGALRLVEQIAGEGVMHDLRVFFKLIGPLSRRFSEHSEAVADLLAHEQTRYFLVTSAAAPDRSDVLGFLGELERRGMNFAGFLVNRTAPRVRPHVADDLSEPPNFPGDWPAWKAALERIPAAARARAALHDVAIERLRVASGGAPIWRVPDLVGGVDDLNALRALLPHLPPEPPA